MSSVAIDVRGLRKKFADRVVVDDLTLSVDNGAICGFLGANGSGKTTTIRMLCGLLTPDGGAGTCLGYDIFHEAALIRRQTGYMTQKFSYYGDLTVRENIQLVADIYETPNACDAVEAIIERMGLAERRRQLAGELSGGWKQRLALAACLVHQPRLLLLDEPTAGVDAKARREFWDTIHEMSLDGLTVLVSTHYMDEADRCTKIVYLGDGRIVVQGTSAEVVAQSGLVVFETSGASINDAARALRTCLREQSVTVFGQQLHVAGKSREEVTAALRRPEAARLQWREISPSLEDVFVHMLTESEARQ
jgi:ABC-2 type transport system ATP-binding protein